MSTYKTYLIFISLMLSQHIFAHGIVNEDVERIRKALENNKHNLELRIEYASKLIRIQHYKEAQIQFDIIRQLDPDNIAVDRLAAENYFEQERFYESVKYIDRFLSKNKNNVKALELKGRAYMKLGSFSDAAKSFSESISVSSRNPDNFLYLARALQAQGDIDGAISALDHGKRLRGNLPIFYLKQAELRAVQGKYLAAAQLMKELLSTMDKDLIIENYMLMRADYLAKAGRKSEAKELYKNIKRTILARNQRVRMTPLIQTIDEELNARLNNH